MVLLHVNSKNRKTLFPFKTKYRIKVIYNNKILSIKEYLLFLLLILHRFLLRYLLLDN